MSVSEELRSRAAEFAHSARLLCDALETPPREPEKAALLLLRALSSVYAKGLALDWAGDQFSSPDLGELFPVSDAERQRVTGNVARIFGERRFYWLQFDPIFPRDGSAAPVAGDLADDFGDIYRDILPALRAWEAGSNQFDDIVFDWRATPFEGHWGVHASNALRALHRIVFDHGLDAAPKTT
ncbi:MAG: DUF5063 domain-containing protein [Myxococcota bacterium]